MSNLSQFLIFVYSRRIRNALRYSLEMTTNLQKSVRFYFPQNWVIFLHGNPHHCVKQIDQNVKLSKPADFKYAKKSKKNEN